MPEARRVYVSMIPSISIVTICKNAGATIERALASVKLCGHSGVQYVVVDGGSTDNTTEIIQRYRPFIDKFISEPDEGISDALNKAIELTDGDFHMIVHADDTLSPGALSHLVRHVGNSEVQVICGSVSVVNDREIVRKFKADPSKLTEKMSIPHMGALVRKEAWSQVGRYDVRRKVAMDHLLMLRIWKRFGLDSFGIVDEVVANYFLGGLSDRHIKAGFREVRDNLMEEGIGRIHANAAYMKLIAKDRLARIIGRR